MTKRDTPPIKVLGLADHSGAEPIQAAWIGALIALGTRLSRNIGAFRGRQLIVAITVPGRTFCSALVGTGWTLGRPPTASITDPLTVLRSAVPGHHYRAVNATSVLSGQFHGLDEMHNPPRVVLAGQWAADRLVAVAPNAYPTSVDRMARPKIGSIGRLAGITEEWDRRLVAPAADLAIVGTRMWIEADLEAVLTHGDDTDGDALRTMLLPRTERSTTWFAQVISASGLADHLPLPGDLNLAILDGQGAIRYLNDILTPMVLCVFDRSVADESAQEDLIQLRNTRGTIVSLNETLGWSAPSGIESLAFTVAL